MDNLDNLLKYQELDIKLRRALDTLERSAANKKMEQARAEFNAAKKTVQESEQAAERVIAEYEQAIAYFNELTEKVNELELIIENAESEEDLNGVAEQLDSLKGKIASLEKKITEFKTLSETLIKNYQDATSRGLKMRDLYNAAKEEYGKLVKSAQPEINEIKAKLKELEAQIAPEIMEQYKAITAENKYPAFVEVHISDGVYSCRGCGLQLSQKNTSTLNENGSCNCETCRRVIFKR